MFYQLKTIIVVNHSLFEIPVPQGQEPVLSKQGSKAMAKQANKIKSFLDKDDKVLFVVSPDEYLIRSFRIFSESWPVQAEHILHPKYWGDMSRPNNNRRMLNFLNLEAKKRNASVVILITNIRGVVDLSMLIQEKAKKYAYNFYFFGRRGGTVHLLDTTRKQFPKKIAKHLQIRQKRIAKMAVRA